MTKPVPANPKLYATVKKEAKERFASWPSAYGSGWLVREYKRRGGTYTTTKKPKEGLDRWFKENWVDVCQLPKKIPCGRDATDDRKFPYCRPLIRVNKRTPTPVKELSKQELKKRCTAKRKLPYSRIR